MSEGLTHGHVKILDEDPTVISILFPIPHFVLSLQSHSYKSRCIDVNSAWCVTAFHILMYSYQASKCFTRVETNRWLANCNGAIQIPDTKVIDGGRYRHQAVVVHAVISVFDWKQNEFFTDCECGRIERRIKRGLCFMLREDRYEENR